MREKISHKLLELLLIFPLFMFPLGGSSGISLFLLENALEGQNEPKNTISEPIKDPAIEEIVENICFCESSGNPDALVVDTNFWHSRGVAQFQFPTFTSYGQKYGILTGDESQEEIINMMHDETIAKDLAYRMLEEDINNLFHWKNCSIKLGYL